MERNVLQTVSPFELAYSFGRLARAAGRAINRIIWLLSLLLLLPAAVQAQDFTYTINSDSVSITGYTGPGGAVVIPDTIEGLPVTAVQGSAFSGITSMTSVIIPDSVITIGPLAFYYCYNLRSAMIGDSVTVIDAYAFFGCASLTSMIIPDSVTQIGSRAFFGCSSLANLTIGNSVTSIEFQTFYGCSNLTSLTIGQSVLGILNFAFAECTALTDVTIPDSVTTLHENAFSGCLSLTSVMIGRSVNTIGTTAFSSCSSLVHLAVDSANPYFSSIDGVLFDKANTTLIRCPGGIADGYAIPSNIATIGHNAFAGCVNLTSITIPDSVASIGPGAFSSCTNLGSVAISNGVTTIGDYAFQQCAALTSVTLPDSVTTLGGGAFNQCTSLRNIAISDKITTIRESTFSNCTNLTSVTIPRSVISIGNAAFFGCTSLRDVYFKGDAPTPLGESIFVLVNHATVYYLPGTTGWEATFAGRPTVLWNPTPQITGLADPFGFTITGSDNLVIVVEAATSLTSPDWTPVGTNTLTDGSSPFSDPQWMNHPARYYRLRSP